MSCHHRCLIPLLLFSLVLLASLIAFPAQADVGLPPAHPGWSISPGDFVTNVQMVSEEVLIDVQTEPDQAEVEAVFHMLNQSSVEETFDVWFPLGEEIYAGKEDRLFKADDFRAWVGENEVDVTIDGLDEAKLVWAHWPVSFPAGESVVLRVTYKLAPALGHSTGWHQRYEYMLETGAGWKDAIESARIIVHAPYSLTEPNHLFQVGDPFYVKPLGYAPQGDNLIWTFYGLEPTAEHNIDFYVFYPSIWASILEAHEDIKATGGSGESHWELAHGLALWLSAFSSRPYAFTPSRPMSPDLEYVSTLIFDSYVRSFEAGVLDTSHLESVIFNLRNLGQYADPPELDGFFQTALAQRPDDIALQETYEMAINLGYADGMVPPTPLPATQPAPTATRPQATPSPPSGRATNPPTYLIAGTVCILLAGLAFLYYIRNTPITR
jgi:hypothetical protein